MTDPLDTNESRETEPSRSKRTIAAILLPLVLLSLGLFVSVRQITKLKKVQSREDGIRTCHQQQEQLAQALLAYRKAHAGEFPKSLDMLYPEYVRDPKIFICPLADKSSVRTRKREDGTEARMTYEYIPAQWSNPRMQKERPWRVFVEEIVPENGALLQVARCSSHVYVEDRVGYVEAIMADGRLADVPYLVDWYFGREKLTERDRDLQRRMERQGSKFSQQARVMPPVHRYR